MFGLLTTKKRLRGGIVVGVLLALGTPMTAQAATWYASATNSSTPPNGTACTLASPCTLSYALGTKVAAGDKLILFSGTYSDKPDLNTPSKHSNLTITAMPAVVSALTFTRGIVTGGTDNRPYLLRVGQLARPGRRKSGVHHRKRRHRSDSVLPAHPRGHLPLG